MVHVFPSSTRIMLTFTLSCFDPAKLGGGGSFKPGSGIRYLRYCIKDQAGIFQHKRALLHMIFLHRFVTHQN